MDQGSGRLVQLARKQGSKTVSKYIIIVDYSWFTRTELGTAQPRLVLGYSSWWVAVGGVDITVSVV